MPTPEMVHRYARKIREQNKKYTTAKAYATAWSIYCKYAWDPKERRMHCRRPRASYLKR